MPAVRRARLGPHPRPGPGTRRGLVGRRRGRRAGGRGKPLPALRRRDGRDDGVVQSSRWASARDPRPGADPAPAAATEGVRGQGRSFAGRVQVPGPARAGDPPRRDQAGRHDQTTSERLPADQGHGRHARAWNGSRPSRPTPGVLRALEAIATEAEGTEPEPKPGPKAGATPCAGVAGSTSSPGGAGRSLRTGVPDSVAGGERPWTARHHVACVRWTGPADRSAGPTALRGVERDQAPAPGVGRPGRAQAGRRDPRNHPAPSCTLRDARRGRQAAPGRGIHLERLENHDTDIEPDEKGKDARSGPALEITAIVQAPDAIMRGMAEVVGDRPFVRDAEDRPGVY